MNKKLFKIFLLITIIIGGAIFAYVGGALFNARLPIYKCLGKNTIPIITGCAMALVYGPFLYVVYYIKENLLKNSPIKKGFDLYFKLMIIVPLIILPFLIYGIITGNYKIKLV